MGIGRILREEVLQEALPEDLEIKTPTLVFKYSTTIRSKICNYKQIAKNINVDHFIENFDDIECGCESSPFVDQHHKHIITGDLSVIELECLRNLLKNGPGFREQLNFSSPSHILRYLSRDIKKGIEGWAKYERLPIEAFKEWEVKLMDILKKRVGRLFFQHRTMHMVPPKNVLERDDVIEYLKELHTKFVVTLVDKTTNNFAFVCKKFYICSILRELGLWPGEEGLTYKKSDLSKPQVIDKLRRGSDFYLKNERFEDVHYELPFIYAIVKMHKTPIKLRFIIASCKSPNKTLARVAMLGLDACEKQIERFCESIRNFTGIIRFFAINNFQKMLMIYKS